MHPLLVRIVGLALCATALTGCGMLGDGADENSLVMPGDRTGDNSPVGADLSAAVRQAQLLRTKGDLDGATRVLSQLMLAAPDDPRVVGEYGKLLVQQGRTDDAVQFLRRAIELQPGDWSLYSALGVAYDQRNDQPNAKLAYERGLALKPGEPAILNNYAMSRMLAGDTISARRLMALAQASGSTDPKIARNLALLNGMAPAPATAMAPAMLAMAATPVAPRVTVASNGFPPVIPPAHGAPAAITRGGSRVVMQEVPIVPLAGPVGRTAHSVKPAAKPAKPSWTARATHHPAPRLAAVTPKARKKAKPNAKDQIPALRMTADAGKP